MRKRLIAIAGALFASLGPAHAFEPYLGQIQTFPYTFCPAGWAPLNGQILPITGNTALFSLLGFDYGGDGKTNFALPLAKPIYTLTGRPLLQCISLQGVFPARPETAQAP